MHNVNELIHSKSPNPYKQTSWFDKINYFQEKDDLWWKVDDKIAEQIFTAQFLLKLIKNNL